MSKLIYRSDSGYSIELDISSSMRRAIHDNNPDILDKEFAELKSLIAKNTNGMVQPYKVQFPWFLRRFF